MSLVNVAYASTLTWSDPSVTRLEAQTLVPLFGEHPIELGAKSPGTDLVPKLQGVATYVGLFAEAFPGNREAVTIDNIAKAVASFERTLLSGNSPYDRFHAGDATAMSESAQRGEALYFSRSLSCFRCHGGATFAETTEASSGRFPEFHNTGLYNLPGQLSYPPDNLGIYAVTHNVRDVGKFKVPTLRNVAVTAPYMHDGSIATLDDVINHYAVGGRTIWDGPNSGVGHDNRVKSALIKGFTISADERADLLAFFNALTDSSFLRDARFGNPWTPRP